MVTDTPDFGSIGPARRRPNVEVLLFAQDDADLRLMQKAAARTSGAALTAFSKESYEDQSLAAKRYADYGSAKGFSAEGWLWRAEKVQREGGHIVSLIMHTAEIESGNPTPEPFYDELAYLRAGRNKSKRKR